MNEIKCADCQMLLLCYGHIPALQRQNCAFFKKKIEKVKVCR